MTDFVGNALNPPNQKKLNGGLYTTDRELLASTVGYTQKGCTIAAGNGIIPLGTVMGQITASKLWKVCVSTASDGSQTARGVLRNTVDTGVSGSTDNVQGNLIVMGTLVYSLMSGADATAITTLNARYDQVFDLFNF